MSYNYIITENCNWFPDLLFSEHSLLGNYCHYKNQNTEYLAQNFDPICLSLS